MLIGITTTFDDEKEHERVNRKYIDCIVRAGGIPLLLPRLKDKARTEELFHSLAGIVLTGGGDVDPGFYGDNIQFEETKDISRKRDMFEMQLVRLAYDHDTPLFGICRGMQVMNVALGGSLHQDVKTCELTELNHFQEQPFENCWQNLSLQSETVLASFFPNTGEICVNSIHHQAIKRVAACLAINAISEDGLVEGIEDASKRFFLGVQWHPEYLEDNQVLFDAFCAAAGAEVHNPWGECTEY